MKWLIGGAALLAATSATSAAGQPTPLFSSDSVIRVTIKGPVRAVARQSETGNVSQMATMTVTGTNESYSVRLSPRGISRRRKEVCQFAPLRVELMQPAAAGALFAGQRRLKLVTHCRDSASFQQNLLLEYSAYRLFNLLTPTSYRARLASIDYVEADGRPLVSRLGFFIEDLDDVAKRAGLRQAPVGDRVLAAQLQAEQSGRVGLFQYMIGNLDWSMRAGPSGEGCCHNSRLLTGAAGGLVPVPYDFDHSGLVDAPYATPPEVFRINSVKTRVYQGYCRHNASALAAAAEFRAKRPAIDGLFAQIPSMDVRTQRKAAAFLARFFDDISTNETMSAKVLKRCMGG